MLNPQSILLGSFGAYFDNAPVLYGLPEFGGVLRPNTVDGRSPQQVIDSTLGFRQYAGDYQRSCILIDHSGSAVEDGVGALDLLGEEVIPVLRNDFAS